MPPAAAPTCQVLESVAQLPQRYRGALLDQFGVLHDGQKPYPGAVEAVAKLAGRGMRLLVISNSSRREGACWAPRNTRACLLCFAWRSAACAGAG
jgi:phosphoglycolate phosphatase-like HAD superfamily hydrolase